MGQKTKIEWTDATWNPIRGCSRISEGCRNCYAEAVAARFSKPGQPYEGLAVMGQNGPRWTGKVALVEKHLHDPLRWKKPKRIFVNSMSDLFHESVPDEWIELIFAVMALAPQHTFQVLTKRPERMAQWVTREGRWPLSNTGNHMATFYKALEDFGVNLKGIHFNDDFRWPLKNVWLGVSVEDQATADERIPLLLKTPCAVRFVSAEPLLGHVSLINISASGEQWDALDRVEAKEAGVEGACAATLDWVIVGGESGHGARPMHPDWAASLRDQCRVADVPFFFKQWGEWMPFSTADGNQITPFGEYGVSPESRGSRTFYRNFIKTGKKRAGRLLDGREWNQFPK